MGITVLDKKKLQIHQDPGIVKMGKPLDYGRAYKLEIKINLKNKVIRIYF
jgi:hypothetical protein